MENLAVVQDKLNQINKLLKLALIKEVKVIDIVAKANKKTINLRQKLNLIRTC
ncbi:hypothetical protein MICAE_590003 [Microcystis aeruginosa PCC 9806]|uniref:Uncharacterized protein n=1 Tax=Microcystis aeruginosa PCC 9806 TaxID=1160282 RepID=I4H0T6_MICAE|nr:hypothetical protein MICAE_590003 [Microcystis aeruginosa PCC 9806]